MSDFQVLVGFGAFLALILIGLLFRKAKTPAKPARKNRGQIVVDGTNVLFWDQERAKLPTLRKVIKALEVKGFDVVVFLDASTRHHLGDRSLNEAKFAQVLGLQQDRVMVVPKGTEADQFILDFARQQKISVVSNDKFRDRPAARRSVRVHHGSFDGKRVRLSGL